MKGIFINWLVIEILTCTFVTSVEAQTPKGKLFIIGGGDKPPEMMSRMVHESGLTPDDYAVILPMSGANPDSSVYYAKNQFAEAGWHRIYGVNCNAEDADSPSKADSIRKAKLVYITGGDQSRFMDIADGSDVVKAIQEAYASGALIGGTSAGAALMSEIMITGNQKKFPDYTPTFSVIESGNIETRKGLGLIPGVIIDQHFLIRSRHNRLLTAILEFPGMKGIGIDESTAILVSGNHAEVIGLSQVLVYSASNKKVKHQDNKLASKDLRLDIYLPGESFRLK